LNPPLLVLTDIYRLSHVSLALIYASLTKLFLLSLLVIWRPAESLHNATSAIGDNFFEVAYHVFDDDRLNREWLLRNLLGGMASGFAIRGKHGLHRLDGVTDIFLVVLNGRPLVAAFIVLFAWVMKAGAAFLLSDCITNTAIDRQWLIFSMP
jgi:lipid intermediate transporter